uniref:Recep_L_domain domain-containing protein n=1 Tax=Heterorhabditis bacteriophora TaxID=37862 RepID=A0A1I7WWG9_HETBA
MFVVVSSSVVLATYFLILCDKNNFTVDSIEPTVTNTAEKPNVVSVIFNGKVLQLKHLSVHADCDFSDDDIFVGNYSSISLTKCCVSERTLRRIIEVSNFIKSTPSSLTNYFCLGKDLKNIIERSYPGEIAMDVMDNFIKEGYIIPKGASQLGKNFNPNLPPQLHIKILNQTQMAPSEIRHCLLTADELTWLGSSCDHEGAIPMLRVEIRVIPLRQTTEWLEAE